MTSARGKTLYRYKAFISYSHAADNRLAPALRTALHGFAKPWYRLRAMRVFRDETGLAITPALWPSIEAAQLEADHAVEQGLLRIRLASLAGRHPRLAQVWSAAAPIVGVSFTPDGAWVVVYSPEGSVQAWDAQTASAAFKPPSSPVVDVAVTPQGRRVLTVDTDGAHLWDTLTGEQGRSLAHDTPVSRARFTASGQPVTDPLEHCWGVGYAAFSPDGQQVVTASQDRTARLWSLSPGSVDAAGWRRRAQLLAARRIDETGAVVTIDTAQFLDVWKNANHQP